ncbi:MAG: cysteine--tRNA ligase [Candidatus Shapirobacteria bacterium]|nr:cysteine--tRNA ligase [Candidatus Shapirobacteria bacterium]
MNQEKTKKLLLFNTLTRQLELFKPIFSPRVRVYTCGPTVYDHTHLGHMRTYTNTDILIRTLKYCDYQPYQVMNITDVGHLTSDRNTGEDKLEKAAQREGVDAWQLVKKYSQEFFGVLDKLNINNPSVTPKATENIAEMILLVCELEKKGFAYQIDDGIYFNTSRFSNYGQLANVSLADLEEGARVEKNIEKKNPTDFALWKFSNLKENRQMEWPSPWAKRGFPGWHIECSVMAMKYLSDCFKGGKFYPERFETIDIHTGGIEHINVHHTNEIAQSEAATNKKFVNYWLHYNWLQVDGRKMSKSLGNFFTQKDLADRGYQDLMFLRYLFLNTHYRKRMNFTWEALDQAKKTYQEIIYLLRKIISQEEVINQETEEFRQTEKTSSYFTDFNKAVTTDLNMPQALAVVHRVLKDKGLFGSTRWHILKNFDQVLGLDLEKQVSGALRESKKKIPQKIKTLVEVRQKNRQEENWRQADLVRAQIEAGGYLIEDTPTGPKLTPKK